MKVSAHQVGALSLWELLGLGPAEETVWMREAVCAQTDPEAFFPEQGESPRAGQAVCAGCPVQRQCLAYAVARPGLEGTWGGTSTRQRKAIRRRSAVDDEVAA